MTVWGEVVFPVAPASYWNAFAKRLDQTGHLDLLVKWLPFSDPTKVLYILKIFSDDFTSMPFALSTPFLLNSFS